MQPCRQAIGGYDIETDGGQEHAPRRASLGVAREHRLENGGLSGDVEIVHTRAQARVDHRPARLRVGAGAVQHETDVAEAFDDRVGRGEVEDADGQAEPCAERLDRFPAAAGQDRAKPAIARRVRR